MGINNLKVNLLENTPFLNSDGTFDLKRAMTHSGHIAGICYNQDGLAASFEENPDKTERRVNMNANNGHQSVFEHIGLTLDIENSPKMFNMVLNNEGQYNASERSLRYTKPGAHAGLSDREVELYDKWYHIFLDLIEQNLGTALPDRKKRTLAQENARSMTSVFYQTELVYTVPLAQLNRLLMMMEVYEKESKGTSFDERLIDSFHAFRSECERLHLVDERLLTNFKNRHLRLFAKPGDDLDKKFFRDEFGESYSTTYTESFAAFAQAQRHRTISYQIQIPEGDKYGYFVPELLSSKCKHDGYDGRDLTREWQQDIQSIRSVYPNGMKIAVQERGTLENFIEKLKERECTAAQYEIWKDTDDTLTEYMEALDRTKHPAADRLRPYTKTMRCGFPDFTCTNPCGNPSKNRIV